MEDGSAEGAGASSRAPTSTAIVVERVRCPVCELPIHPRDIASHATAHSSRIMDHLYLGAERNASNHKELTTRTGIHRILNVAWEVGNYFPDDFSYMNVPVSDDGGEDLFATLDTCIDFIDDAGKKGERVLVHCVQGISRSASVVIAYLMRNHGWSLQAALKHVREARPIIRPHKGFLHQLLRYEQHLADRGIIAAATPSLAIEDEYPPGEVLLSGAPKVLPAPPLPPARTAGDDAAAARAPQP